MARAVITEAAGATTGFLHNTGAPREESSSDHALVLSSRVLSGPFKGERATITLVGDFDLAANEGEVRQVRESVNGDLHFSLTFERPVDLADFIGGDVSEPIALIGNDFANVLDGDVTADRLVGNGGTDRLIGERGADDLVGGAGADVFLFKSVRDSTSERHDTIRDFGNGNDVLNLKAIDADEGHNGNQAFDFVGDDPFTGTAGELRIIETARATLVVGDTDGDRSADLSIRLVGHHVLAADDFIL